MKREEFEKAEAEVVEDKEEKQEENSSQQLLTNEEENEQYLEQKPLMIEEEEKLLPVKSAQKTECVCQKCGKANPLGSKFCNECGTLIDKGE